MVPFGSREINFQVYERSCMLQKFINRLDEADGFYYYPTDGELNSIGEPQREIIKKVYSMLYRNYNTINAYKEYIKTYCCNYLNYWLDTEKSKYATYQLRANSDVWQVIENLWINLEEKSTPFKCKRNTDKTSLEKQKHRMNLMVYCVNRDELKSKCYNSSGLISQNYCLTLFEYISKNYKALVKENQCLKYKDKSQDYEFHFDDKCTLHDIPKTFPDYHIQGGKLSEKTSSKSLLPYCEDTQKATQYFQEHHEGHSVQLDEETSLPYSSPWNSIAYVGLTVFVIFFFFLIFLYKFTSLRSILPSLLIKKNKMRQYIDKQGENELLEAPSYDMEYNLGNEEYNFTYQPLQS
ncbi:PIR Superfamily Protein [Plasmodium ovale wallikeri]|uniref:PIR Superfamily Protein n=1 Tax=Plasmodium ovale wallikeri TaxID=864142 RepID=A0A1A9AP98_PLAOA|nr:PIR Superfamily Protein [Plasmodium ovale wallikeri]SBT58056.1 PIR Superfamily Protein [Plasmodium ovale wallikeri]